MASKAKVYSYMRFSTPEQVEGDSIHRQTTAAEKWAQREGLKLDKGTTMADMGESAFRGQHRDDPDRTALAAFLDAVKKGRVERGSYLVIESLDRLTRESLRPALTLLLNLIEAGVRVVQLQPREMVYDEQADLIALVIAIMELSRGHAESAMKSWRNGQAWEASREAARGGVVMCGRRPAWVRVGESGALELVPERAAAIREIFRLAAAGHGVAAIMRRLDAAGHRPFGAGLPAKPGKKRRSLADRWQSAYVRRLLGDRRLLGELQPRLGDGSPVGPVIPGYYPPVVSEQDLVRVAAVRANRRKASPVRDRKNVNTFGGLLRDHTGSRVIVRSKAGRLVLTSDDSNQGRAPELTFPYPIFEGGMLRVIREVRPDEVAGAAGGAGEADRLKDERDAAEAEVMAVFAQCVEGTATPMLASLLKVKEARLAEAQAAYDEARQREAHPAAEAWESCRTLAGLLEEAQDKDDVRVRIRSALRGLRAAGTLLIVPRGRWRLCLVQVRFGEPDVTRFALLLYRQGSRGRESLGWVESRADVPEAFDLGDAAHAAEMREKLLRLDVPTLLARLSSAGAALPA